MGRVKSFDDANARSARRPVVTDERVYAANTPPRTLFSENAQPPNTPADNPGCADRRSTVGERPRYRPSMRLNRKILRRLFGNMLTRGGPVFRQAGGAMS